MAIGCEGLRQAQQQPGVCFTMWGSSHQTVGLSITMWRNNPPAAGLSQLLSTHRGMQVCELFDITPEKLLQPASQRELLAALLAHLLEACWAVAVRCSAAPGLMVSPAPAAASAYLDRLACM